MEILTVEAGTVPDSFAYLGVAFSSYYVALSSSDMMVCAWSYCCAVWLMFLGGLFFSKGRQRGDEPGKEERHTGQGRLGGGGRGNYNMDGIYGRRI